jgi:DNA-binding NtrC family response regulator
MNPAVTLKEKVETVLKEGTPASAEGSPWRLKILAATIDPDIRNSLTELLEGFSIDAVWLKSVEAAKNLLSREKIAACFCGFWLQDGTYRQLVNHIRQMRVATPVIIVSGPACPEESRDFLAAMNLGSINFLAYPFDKGDLKRIFQFATEIEHMPAGRESSLIVPGSVAGEAA